MADIKVLYGNSIMLRGIKESDIDDRLKIDRHNEFVNMCGGETLENLSIRGVVFG